MALNSMKVRTALTLKPNTVPTSPENGDMYYDSGTNLFNFRQNGAWVTIAATTPYRAGTQAVSSGAVSQVITFSSTLGTTSYAISAKFVNTTDSNPQFQPTVITAQSATGFTVTWNEPTASANYSIEYIAIPNV